MKLSQVIEQLTALKDRHGDVDLFVFDEEGYDFEAIKDVKFYELEDGQFVGITYYQWGKTSDQGTQK